MPPASLIDFVMIVLLSLLASPASAVELVFSASILPAAAPLAGTVFDSFGSSHGSTTLRSTWRSHFASTQHDIAFQRVRFHGILDDDMSTYMDGQASGALVFDTLDWLVAQHITPTVEIGFMPEQLASHPDQYVFHYKGGTSPPADWSKWNKFITQFAQLLVDRYSAAVVRTWLFEVWNEPNCGFYAVYDCCGAACGNFTAYFELYSNTAHAIKAVDSQLQVGGPATAQLSWISDFVNLAYNTSTPIDFVSSHLYPTDIVQTRESFMDAIANATAMARSQAKVPFYVTEFNAGLGLPDGPSASILSVLDTSYAAAFLLHAHLRAQAIDGLVSMSYWTFTDFGFEEGGVDPLPWNPGASKFGIQTMYGVKKPAYRGMQFISDWRAGMAVPVKADGAGSAYRDVHGAVIGATAGTVDVMVAVADGGVVTVLLGNYDAAASTVSIPAVANVTVTLSGFGDILPANATLELIDDSHANPYAVWRAAGSPLYPTADEVEAEMAASAVIPMSLAVEASGEGSVRVRVTLQPYAVARVRLVVVPQSQPFPQSAARHPSRSVRQAVRS